jgi:2-oxoglutarate dehydrogenase E1 component
MRAPVNRPSLQNHAFVEELYARFRHDANSVAPEWREYFSQNADANGNGPVISGPSFAPRSLFHPMARTRSGSAVRPDPLVASVSERLSELVRNHRVRGHIIAAIDPLGRPRPCPPELALDYYGFTARELDLPLNPATLQLETPLTVREVFQRLRDIYCRAVGVQYMHIDNLAIRQWLQRRIENPQGRAVLARGEQLRILTRLTDAVVFEEFLRRKFLGAKTFSLEGSETLLPLLDLALEKAGGQGVHHSVIGMGHRGRLNVLAHIIGKEARDIFREFADGEPESWFGRGDVKYHLGHSGDWVTSAGHNIHLSLCFNPSHLEFVDPVVMGRVRAQQDRLGDDEHRQVFGLLIHGDAAFAGEGVVQESLNLSRLRGYSIGGALHIIVNNHIGFTTLPEEGRSTIYATDVARMLQVPIFHVNGEDPEAVAQVVQVAMDFRAEFQMDAFIDMHGYRRWGHNETDEPAFTQPELYRKIKERPSVREGYLEHLLAGQKISREEADQIMAARQARLEEQLKTAPVRDRPAAPERTGLWRGYTGGPEPANESVGGIGRPELARLLEKLTELPAGFQVHRKLERGLQRRREMAAGTRPLDWAAAEGLALATLATQGVRIRLTGQDTVRGTFSQRHAVLFDQEDGHPFCPLQNLGPEQAPVEIYNSPLCETGALGFEYGYSLDCPDGLVMWEAQFGDFVNAAQVIIDQFICSAEDKWRRLSGLVLLLPHGFEGMGPEHSSAQLERFLVLAAEDNIQVIQPTTPAQYFHALRRQALRKWRKPLVVLTPKSLLRHPRAVSPLDDFARGEFQRVLPDMAPSQDVKRVLLVSGKIYFALAAYRERHRRTDVAILRLEQFYPLRAELLEDALQSCPDKTPVHWVQEEPANLGAWRYLHERFGQTLFNRLPFSLVSRAESASPATGSARAHKIEEARLLARAFGDPEPDLHELLAAAEKHGPPLENPEGGEP